MGLGQKPKSFVVSVTMKGSWPMHYVMVWNYTSLNQSMKHLEWVGKKIATQHGKNAVRKQVVVDVLLAVYRHSKKRNKRFPPLRRFVDPKGVGLPDGGKKLQWDEKV